jgi:hypothetical protein
MRDQDWTIQDNNSLGSMTCCKIVRDFKSQEILVGVIQTFHSIFLEIQAGDLQSMAIVEANTLIFCNGIVSRGKSTTPKSTTLGIVH